MDILHNLVSREEKTVTFRLLLSSVCQKAVTVLLPCQLGCATAWGWQEVLQSGALWLGSQQLSALSRTEVEPEGQVEIWGEPWSKRRWLGPRMGGREKGGLVQVCCWVTRQHLFLHFLECSSTMGEWTRAQNHGVTRKSSSQCCQQGSLLGLWSV